MTKYRARGVTIEGRRFDSQAEARRWQELELLARAGEIADLRHHVAYPLVVNGVKIASYEADAVYQVVATGATVVEDTKGVVTAVYRLKKALMRACHGVTIHEVSA